LEVSILKAKVQKWGNSLAVRIPKSIAMEAHLKQDTPVEVTFRDGGVVVSPMKPDYTLEELLDQITEENKHSEVDFGPAIGAEVW
jgi:antitoxin MazE